MSKSSIKEDLSQVATFIKHNKTLQTIVLQKLSLSDEKAEVLIEPIASSNHLKVLRLDFNKLSHRFIENLCYRLMANPIQVQRTLSALGQVEQTLNTSSSGISLIPEEAKTDRHRSHDKEGLDIISFEGNQQIGDLGTKALATLVRTPNNSTKNLSKINLKECGITNEGYLEMKEALTQRGSLSHVANLSHVAVNVDRNNISLN